MNPRKNREWTRMNADKAEDGDDDEAEGVPGSISESDSSSDEQFVFFDVGFDTKALNH
jgi:hypothetical protein